jgi:tRNA(Arg) A34 adenosine deaminase TadA
VFGAAILRKADWSLVIARTNAETLNPRWHGEVATLKAFYDLPAADRPATSECLFLSTHEPCFLCLSAITWAGFDNFHYFFGYDATRDTFAIPHNLKILQGVFEVENGDYRRQNVSWTSHDPMALCKDLMAQAAEITRAYAALSDTYQNSKGGNDIPLR